MTDDEKTTVVNLRHTDEYDQRIDRRTQFGNPFPIDDYDENGRERCIEDFRSYFDNKIETDDEFRKAVESLKGKTLACWCKPKDCHGDVIVEYLEGEA